MIPTNEQDLTPPTASQPEITTLLQQTPLHGRSLVALAFPLPTRLCGSCMSALSQRFSQFPTPQGTTLLYCSQVAIFWNLCSLRRSLWSMLTPFHSPKMPRICSCNPFFEQHLLQTDAFHIMPHAICYVRPFCAPCYSPFQAKAVRLQVEQVLGSDMWACLVFASYDASLLHVFPSSALHLSVACQKHFLALLQPFPFSLMLLIHRTRPGIVIAEALLALPSPIPVNVKLMRSADQLPALVALPSLCSAHLIET